MCSYKFGFWPFSISVQIWLWHGQFKMSELRLHSGHLVHLHSLSQQCSSRSPSALQAVGYICRVCNNYLQYGQICDLSKHVYYGLLDRVLTVLTILRYSSNKSVSVVVDMMVSNDGYFGEESIFFSRKVSLVFSFLNIEINIPQNWYIGVIVSKTLISLSLRLDVMLPEMYPLILHSTGD